MVPLQTTLYLKNNPPKILKGKQFRWVGWEKEKNLSLEVHIYIYLCIYIYTYIYTVSHFLSPLRLFYIKIQFQFSHFLQTANKKSQKKNQQAVNR